MIKILAAMPSAKEVNAFWRSSGPLGYLEKHSKGEISLTVHSYDEETKPRYGYDISRHDILFLARPAVDQDLDFMKAAYVHNIPIWIDWDDWIFDMPKTNPNAKHYLDPLIQKKIFKLMQCANVISVSTEELARQIRIINPNVVVLPNAYRTDYFSKFIPETYPDRKPFTMWRGSATHTGDLLQVVDQFRDRPGKDPIHFYGNIDWKVLTKMDKGCFHLHPAMEIMEYFHRIYQDLPKVCIIPLEDNLFNHCKSNIAWMEALHAGAVCVAPDWPEWRKPGVVTYDPKNISTFKESWHSAWELSMDCHKFAYDQMKEHFGIQTINRKRELLVTQIMNGVYPHAKDPFIP